MQGSLALQPPPGLECYSLGEEQSHGPRHVTARLALSGEAPTAMCLKNQPLTHPSSLKTCSPQLLSRSTPPFSFLTSNRECRKTEATKAQRVWVIC